MSAATDLEACSDAIRAGSHSFHAASKLLPRAVRDPALVLYAFCRQADDAVDLGAGKAAAVARLRRRLDRACAGRPLDTPVDRAFAVLVESQALPRALPEALIEGLEWDAEERRYDDLSALRGYCARVAATVGAMMCVLMGVRDRDALARACDLGVAMQFTNIARDVAEDAAAGRLYLPGGWMREAGLDPDRFLAAPAAGPAIRSVVRRLLREADTLYHRSEAGIAALPFACRPGILAARHVYAGIGTALTRAGHDPFAGRARTTRAAKAALLARAALQAGTTGLLPRSPVLYARPLPETAFLVDAAAHADTARPHWSDPVLTALAAPMARPS
ncbi:phytoene/squalene synthase family protein [Limimaricola pyoseonensis]|uniref:Phytoene synthase n=1 Tax=Limimaricola pyoseonensis TaxID=521013 RepID=A0A1G7B1G9_9RHOB|nr:phytoene/squalene synthase family protein [Limimaricola pyoseonensis]SDE20939.1 phytoene synthase [Limimaricola pyoseonensis]